MTTSYRIVEKELNDDSWKVNLGRSKLNVGSVQRSCDWWTGKNPTNGVCPGVAADGKIYPLKAPDLSSCTRDEVRDYFDNGWALTETLFSGLVSDEAFYRPPYHQLRHPLIFYFVHPAVFYVNKLKLAGLIDSGIDEKFESDIFDVGVDEMSWDDMSKNSKIWPRLETCIDYRKQVYELVLNLIDSTDALNCDHEQITFDDPLWVLFMGFEHERIHLETSSVLIRELPVRLVQRPNLFPELHDSVTTGELISTPVEGKDFPRVEFVRVSRDRVTLGKPNNWPSYGWDNEYGSREVEVDQFEVTSELISNGAYLQFILDGGYQRKEFWEEEGWRWRSFRNILSPTFWYQKKNSKRYLLRTIYDTIEMPWSWPVIVNYHEAKAYANWKAIQDKVADPYRLLTEAEHFRLRSEIGPGEITDVNQLSDLDFNLNLKFGSESPVNEKNEKINDLFGNVWQWLEDHFNPLPGFKAHEHYSDFSTPCFDGKHHMILGGSFISTGDEASPFARFHFRSHFFQHAGIRLVKSNSDGGVVHLSE